MCQKNDTNSSATRPKQIDFPKLLWQNNWKFQVLISFLE